MLIVALIIAKLLDLQLIRWFIYNAETIQIIKLWLKK